MNSEGKNCLVKVDVARGNDATRRGIKAAVPAVVGRIAEKDTRKGPVIEFVLGSGGEIWVAQTPKDPKEGVVWSNA